MPATYPKVSVKRCDGGWVVSEARKPDKVITRWQGVLHELHERLYGNEDESSVLRTSHGEFSGLLGLQ